MAAPPAKSIPLPADLDTIRTVLRSGGPHRRRLGLPGRLPRPHARPAVHRQAHRRPRRPAAHRRPSHRARRADLTVPARPSRPPRPALAGHRQPLPVPPSAQRPPRHPAQAGLDQPPPRRSGPDHARGWLMAPRYRSAPEMGSGRTGHHDPPNPGLTATGRALLTFTLCEGVPMVASC